MAKQKVRYESKVESLDSWWSQEKKGTKTLPAHFQYLYLHILTLTHIHSHTENFTEVLKSPQCTLFICFLLPCYIISATTIVAIAAGGTGSISSITQSRWHSCCTGSRSFHGVTCMLLRLWAVVRVLRCPRGPARPTHGVDLCEQTSSGLIFCIVL